jgi:ComF family protein
MLKDLIKGLGELLYPPCCPICLKELVEEKLCRDCYIRYLFKSEIRCQKCGKPMDYFAPACTRCNRSSYDGARFFAIYDGEIKQGIYHMKYGKEKWRGVMFGYFLYEVYKDFWGNYEIHGVIPIPLHRKRELSRGFNQSFLIAKTFSKLSGIPVMNDLIERVKETDFMASLTKEGRVLNLQDAFKLIKTDKIESRNFLIIDDIITSGTTMDYCARILKEAGAHGVFGLTLASGE